MEARYGLKACPAREVLSVLPCHYPGEGMADDDYRMLTYDFTVFTVKITWG
jgi:hypothetical protein